MGERTKHHPGAFSWIDLATTDPEGAKTFYGRLFGWEHEDLPAGDAGVYTMSRLNGKEVAAIFQSDENSARAIPSHWNNYVTVEDADAVAVTKVGQAGGKVLAEPFDVMDAGRMAVVADPTGAILSLWQPARHIGASLVNEPGTLTWNDCLTGDPQEARRFYGEVFGWTFEQVSVTPPFWVIFNQGRSNGGLMALMEQHGSTPPHWMPYFGAESAQETARAAGEIGGRTLVGPVGAPDDGRFAVLMDPQGAAFAIFEGDFDD